MEHILTYVLLFTLGVSLTYIYFKNLIHKSLFNRFTDLENKKVEISQGDYDKLSYDKGIEIVGYKREILRLEKEKDELTFEIQGLKLTLGLVDEYEYGILSNNTIVSTHKDGTESTLRLKCGFKVIQKGSNSVRISINKNDIKGDTVMTEKTKGDILELLDGWYNIDDSDISWVEPDEARKRDVKIDSILNQ